MLFEAAETTAPPRRRPGRPRAGEEPIVPWNEVDALLVFGERVRDDKTGREVVKFPSIAVLAKRYGISKTSIWRYTTRARVYERRKEARLKAQETYERKVIEKMADAQARGAVDVSTIVDDFVSGFRRALDEGRVRVDSPADLDRLVRLKELLSGNADSRAELQGTLTLEAIQVRHRQLRGQLEGMSPELAGTRGHDDGDDPAAGGGERGDGAAE